MSHKFVEPVETVQPHDVGRAFVDQHLELVKTMYLYTFFLRRMMREEVANDPIIVQTVEIVCCQMVLDAILFATVQISHFFNSCELNIDDAQFSAMRRAFLDDNRKQELCTKFINEHGQAPLIAHRSAAIVMLREARTKTQKILKEFCDTISISPNCVA